MKDEVASKAKNELHDSAEHPAAAEYPVDSTPTESENQFIAVRHAGDLRRDIQRRLNENGIQFVNERTDGHENVLKTSDVGESMPINPEKSSFVSSFKHDSEGTESSSDSTENEDGDPCERQSARSKQSADEFIQNLDRNRLNLEGSKPFAKYSMTNPRPGSFAPEDGEPFPDIPEIPSVVSGCDGSGVSPPPPPAPAPVPDPPAASIGTKILYTSAARWSLPLHFDEVLREGWLRKAGGSWPLGGGQRWFTARPGTLVYVRWPGDRRPPRPVPLAPAARIGIADPARAGGAFTIEIEYAGRTHRLTHADRHEAFEWMRAIAQAAAAAGPAAAGPAAARRADAAP
jgi:hypothetical protein